MYRRTIGLGKKHGSVDQQPILAPGGHWSSSSRQVQMWFNVAGIGCENELHETYPTESTSVRNKGSLTHVAASLVRETSPGPSSFDSALKSNTRRWLNAISGPAPLCTNVGSVRPRNVPHDDPIKRRVYDEQLVKHAGTPNCSVPCEIRYGREQPASLKFIDLKIECYDLQIRTSPRNIPFVVHFHQSQGTSIVTNGSSRQRNIHLDQIKL
ncbi:uncharacterized protein HD556DRAFT_1309940 [Suillus plorans]|uniref:Uncharacterized protein n=1 Tax=Suillus plorans TaxID=116603 RepID=A0A9P7DG01_9AGAM|nr:uncharacterized protein HD556DRAFT_1309940 [Suillus plorans]KAG1791354.1 hypothetical protein HD556DRAFT_1309940 [Suillus plorans]